jgi:intergrase/recombinase
MEASETRSEKVMLCPPGTLSVEQRLKLLEELVGRLGAKRAAEKLGISRASLYRYLGRQREIPEELDPRLCMEFGDDELLAVLSNKQLLESAGVLKDGRLNMPLLIALIDAAMQSEEAKQVILKRFLTQYKEELQELLAQTLPRIELHWDKGFEKWLTEKKSKPITGRTLKDYKNIWSTCLQGKVLGWHLLKQLEGSKMLCRDNKYHPTGWIRQVFRHYIRYLYASGKLDWDTYSRLLLAVPGRRYGRRVSQKVVREEDVVETLRKIGEARRGDILTVYLVILASAARLEHVIKMINEWSPDEEVYVYYLNRNIKRLECFNEHCRYYMGKEHDVKPVGFIFFPRILLQLVKTYVRRLPDRKNIYKAVKRRGGLPAKYVRIFAMREIYATLGVNNVSNFILSKFGELTVSARHYRDLLEEADRVYPKYIERWLKLLNKASVSMPRGEG